MSISARPLYDSKDLRTAGKLHPLSFVQSKSFQHMILPFYQMAAWCNVQCPQQMCNSVGQNLWVLSAQTLCTKKTSSKFSSWYASLPPISHQHKWHTYKTRTIPAHSSMHTNKYPIPKFLRKHENKMLRPIWKEPKASCKRSSRHPANGK